MDRIFIVEDDDNIRKLVCYALNKEGFSVSGLRSRANSAKRLPRKSLILFFWI